MAVTLTLEQLADHLRIERAAIGTGDVRRTILVELMQAGTAFVEQYAPDAPRDIQNLALARFAGYAYDAPSAPAGGTYAAMWLNSGCVGLLNPWRDARADYVPATGTTTPATAPTTPDTPDTPVDPEPTATRYFAANPSEIQAGSQPAPDAYRILTESDYLNGVEFTGLRFQLPPLPTPNLPARAYVWAVALPDGEELTSFVLDAFNQEAIAIFRQEADILINGETYHQWVSLSVYFGGGLFDGHFVMIAVTTP